MSKDAFKKLHADIATALQNNPDAKPLAIARCIGATAVDLTVWSTDKKKKQLRPDQHRCTFSLTLYMSNMPSIAEKYSLPQDILPPNREAVRYQVPTADAIHAIKTLIHS